MIDVIPAPRHVAPADGEFRFIRGTRVEFADPPLAPMIDRFCRDVARRTGIGCEPALASGDGFVMRTPSVRVELAREPYADNVPQPIGLSPAADVAPDERYSITVGDARILVRGARAVGIARGLATLTQMLGTRANGRDGAIVLPGCRILDGPRFAWRSLLLDVARTHFPVPQLKRIIDLLALYKFNVLHLHLTDDQAWRIEAGRPPNGRGEDGTVYTDEELSELVAHAAARFVTLLPEADTPGHATSLLVIRPELSTARNIREFQLAPGRIHHCTWLDPDLPATFAVIEEVLGRLADLFPGRYLHIGGDEPFGMPEYLYDAFVRRVIACARSVGRRTIGFQETARAGVDGTHAIQHWISATTQDGGGSALPHDLRAMVEANIALAAGDIDRALDRGIPILVTPGNHTHFDIPYAEPSADPVQEPTRRRLAPHPAEARTVAETFDWDPVAVLGARAREADLAGVGAAIWAETIPDFDALTFQLLPRLAGTADRAWGDGAAGAWEAHRRSLATHGRLWDQDGLTYFRSSSIDWTSKVARAVDGVARVVISPRPPAGAKTRAP